MKNKGFTLLELLIVMAVIAILISMAIPSFRGMQQEARKVKAQGDLRTLQVAVESYYKNQGGYPPWQTGSVPKTYQAYLLEASPRMIESKIYDPFAPANTEYQYFVSGNGQYYILYSVGPDNANGITVSVDGLTASGDDIYVTNGWTISTPSPGPIAPPNPITPP